MLGGGIATRQNTAILYSHAKPLAGNVEVTAPAFEVAGYAKAIFSVISDQPFTVFIEEANDLSGPWTQVSSLDSKPAGVLHRIGDRITPVGTFMKPTIRNSAITQRMLSAIVYGLPL